MRLGEEESVCTLVEEVEVSKVRPCDSIFFGNRDRVLLKCQLFIDA